MGATARPLNIQQLSSATVIMITRLKNETGARISPLPFQCALIFNREPGVWRDTMKDGGDMNPVSVDDSSLCWTGGVPAVNDQEE
ncbi:MAG: hypothetical protein AUH11_03755 [Acidobacteria bacterium 13_2_20CM_57_17]|nr:MAG: hypothetical protein AUH11_03755 [Acidobacteria bacterium 13_2_20CM_57_17]OLE15142.1 MAG: hypothetical protein AUG83_08220 [Acidobacteria bacterium 13_1_20CM_4_57_11]